MKLKDKSCRVSYDVSCSNQLPTPLSCQVTKFCFLCLQGLKYSFQTHDRLCFVMEYANGGEVNHFNHC